MDPQTAIDSISCELCAVSVCMYACVCVCYRSRETREISRSFSLRFSCGRVRGYTGLTFLLSDTVDVCEYVLKPGKGKGSSTSVGIVSRE